MRFGHVLRVVLGLAVALASGASSAIDAAVSAQSLPNPYRMVDGWAQLPNGRQMGAVGKVAIDPDGRHIWAIVRCDPLADPARFGDECRDSKTGRGLQIQPGRQGGDELRWRHVHLAPRHRGRSRGQRLGDRCGRCQQNAARATSAGNRSSSSAPPARC